MSTLLVDELYNGIIVEQPFKITEEVNLAHVRMWIYRHDDLLTGTLQMQILDGADVLATASWGYTDINAAFDETYAHGFLRFDFDALVLRLPEGGTEKEFLIKVQMVGHTTAPTNFIGLVRAYENKIYDTYGTGVVDNEAQNDFVEPFGFELFEYKVF